MFRFHIFRLLLSLLTLTSLGIPKAAIAQVTSAGDSTGTIVNQNGTDFAITGGSTSSDGGNLFHNFADFNLNSQQSATFFTNANIENILSKISGGNPSYIDGLLRVSGSDANLFLLNPSGIVFGSNAQLDLSGDFTASTASSLTFGTQIWTDGANLSQLTGAPTQFIFNSNGAILNAADLTVTADQTINLFAANVVNTGSLKAPQGNLKITAVPETGKLHLSQDGHLLSLEVAPVIDHLTATNLPELLTGSNLDTGVSLVNGTMILDANQATIATASGTVTMTNDLDVSGDRGGTVTILGEKIALIDAKVDASGMTGGGEILIGGDYQGQGSLPRAATTFVNQNSVLDASAIDRGNGGEIIVWSDERTDFDGYLYAKGGVNSGDGGFAEISAKGLLDLAAGWSQRISLAANHGNFGTLLFDPVNILITTSGVDAVTGSPLQPATNSIFSGADISNFLESFGSLEIRTDGGNVSGALGDITIDNTSISWINPSSTLTLTADNNINVINNAAITGNNAVSLIAGNDIAIENSIITANGAINFTADNDITIENSSIEANNGALTLQAEGQIDTGFVGLASLSSNSEILIDGEQGVNIGASTDINLLGGKLTLKSDSGSIEVLPNLFLFGNNVLMTAANDITTQILYGRNVTLTADNDITTQTVSASGGNLTLAAGNDITTQEVSAFGGNLTLAAGNDITTQTVFVSSGNIIATAGNDISTQNISASGGDIDLFANNTITTQNVSTSPSFSSSFSNLTAGNVRLIAPNGIQVSLIETGSFFSDGEPNIIVDAGDVEVITSNGFFRATESNFNNGLSIDTRGIGGGRSGDVYIFHAGNGEVPFIVGNASVNGTAGGISTGTASIDPTQSFLDTYRLGNITIETNSYQDPLCPPNCGDPDGEGTTTTTEEAIEIEDIKTKLKQIFVETKVKPALIYAIFMPATETSAANKGNQDQTKQNDLKAISKVGEEEWEFRGDRLTDFLNSTTTNFLNPREDLRGSDELELVMVSYTGKMVRHRLPGVTRDLVMQEVKKFVGAVTNERSTATNYLPPAQYLYNVLVRPLEADLDKEDIQNLSFIMDDGLRALPVAALHDGQRFIVEKYSVGLMPSFSLTNTSGYVPPRDNTLLAMGAEKFSDEEDLPAAPLEVQVIADRIWQGDSYVDQQFTVDNLLTARARKPYGILHLATHGQFKAGNEANSYIRFQDQRVTLDHLNTLRLNNPPIELLVLSACRTAVGDRQAELGFAGLALASGAKSAIGSIWYVSDAGTMGLMIRLYEELQKTPIKAEALRQAQLALLQGNVRQAEGQLITPDLTIPLPPELTAQNLNFSHPFYWSGFALVGNPW